jgi:hypothetical protein
VDALDLAFVRRSMLSQPAQWPPPAPAAAAAGAPATDSASITSDLFGEKRIE